MTRDPKHYLSDIAASIEKIQRFTEGLTFEDFAANYMAIDAVLFNFQVSDEAASISRWKRKPHIQMCRGVK